MFFFFFNDTATTEIYTLSLHDALPILNSIAGKRLEGVDLDRIVGIAREYFESEPRPFADFRLLLAELEPDRDQDRKSTRLNSSHANISYAVFCLKKKKTKHHHIIAKHV